MWMAKGWMLLNGSAPAHGAAGVMLPHLLYSPGLTPYHLYLFPLMKEWLKGCHFKNEAQTQVASKIVLHIMCDIFQKYCMNTVDAEEWCLRQLNLRSAQCHHI
jgi:hypothetical protein